MGSLDFCFVGSEENYYISDRWIVVVDFAGNLVDIPVDSLVVVFLVPNFVVEIPGFAVVDCDVVAYMVVVAVFGTD